MSADIDRERSPRDYLREAQSLADVGEFAAALERHVWYHANVLRIEPAQYGVRLSFALSAWAALGKRYPQARNALIATRDAAAALVRTASTPRERHEAFHDVAAINRYLPDIVSTVELFQSIFHADAKAAADLVTLAEDHLYETGNWALFAAALPDAMDRLDAMIELREYEIESERRCPPRAELPNLVGYPQRSFRQDVARLSMMLVAGDRVDDAQRVMDAAIEVQGDAETRDALAAAMKRRSS